jgi:hypothetical protein
MSAPELHTPVKDEPELAWSFDDESRTTTRTQAGTDVAGKAAAEAKKASKAKASKKDDDDDGPGPSAVAIVTSFLPFLSLAARPALA